MSNRWSAATAGVLFATSIAAHQFGIPGPTKAPKPLKLAEEWSFLDYVDFGITVVKQPLKIITKSVKEQNADNPQVVSPDNNRKLSFSDCVLGPTALTIYTLCSGILLTTYIQVRSQNFASVSGATKISSIISTLLDSTMRMTQCYWLFLQIENSNGGRTNVAKKISHCYKIIKFAQKFIKTPSNYTIPILFAGATIGIRGLST